MAKKRYYQSKKDRMDESRGMKRYEDKVMDKKDYVNKPSGAEIKYVSTDDSMFGFPADSKVIDYPRTYEFSGYSDRGGPNNDGVAGMDYEFDMTVEGMNKQKPKRRW